MILHLGKYPDRKAPLPEMCSVLFCISCGSVVPTVDKALRILLACVKARASAESLGCRAASPAEHQEALDQSPPKPEDP